MIFSDEETALLKKMLSLYITELKNKIYLKKENIGPNMDELRIATEIQNKICGNM